MLSRHRLADMSSDKLVLCEQGLVSHRALSLLVCQCNSDNVGELRGCFGGAQLKTIVVGNQTVHKGQKTQQNRKCRHGTQKNANNTKISENSGWNTKITENVDMEHQNTQKTQKSLNILAGTPKSLKMYTWNTKIKKIIENSEILSEFLNVSN